MHDPLPSVPKPASDPMPRGVAMIAPLAIGAATAFLVFAAIIPFARISLGIVRVFGFPRLQFLVLTLALMPVTIWLVADPWMRWGLVAAQALAAIVHLATIAQFTPLRPQQSRRFEGDPRGSQTLSLVSCNVKMSNTAFDRAIAVVRDADPDIAIFMEVDDKWAKALQELARGYRDVVWEPLDNSYGMIVMSRLALSDCRVERLVMDDVPSVITAATLPNGARFRLYAVHPEPPVPNADSAGRDAELLIVADRVAEDPLPAVVCGDLNDVAWSHTTRLFQRLSRLLDPRVGRGFYNTFDARFWFMRWPLDHLFHDPRFELVEMDRLDPVGSDHFPILFRLALTSSPDAVNNPAGSDRADRQERADIMDDAEDLDRDAIGTDWEK
ncbi:endonuclease/exonuclease/phosphatase family protein [Aurantimonas sp. A2-1-M11]|uniref:endonuclease/exonuclease/phosphatase family protein n=1 Tax=Aurantimonas sp. A2-1-M11 TaxID=3113712 RepID=UPI002F9479B1